MKNKPTAEEIGGLLFNIHTYITNQNGDEIVYREKDIIELLMALGHPKPKWGMDINIKDFKKSR